MQFTIFLTRNIQVAPWLVPPIPLAEAFRDKIDAMGATRTASNDSKQPHETTRPQAMSCNCFIGVFRACRIMATGISDEARQCQLIEAYEYRAEQSAGSLLPGPPPVATVNRFASIIHIQVHSAKTIRSLRRSFEHPVRSSICASKDTNATPGTKRQQGFSA